MNSREFQSLVTISIFFFLITYPLYKIYWLGWCRVSIQLHFPPFHLHLLVSPSLSCQSLRLLSGRGERGFNFTFIKFAKRLFSIGYLHCPLVFITSEGTLPAPSRDGSHIGRLSPLFYLLFTVIILQHTLYFY